MFLLWLWFIFQMQTSSEIDLKSNDSHVSASKPQPVEKAQKSKTRENEQKAQCDSEKCQIECAKVNGSNDRKKDLLEKLENVMDMEADAMITRMNQFMGNLDTFETLFEPFQSKIAKIEEEHFKKFRELEQEVFNAKTEQFEHRERAIAKQHPDFWANLLNVHPEVELYLTQAVAIGSEVAKANEATLGAITGLKVAMDKKNGEFSTSATLFLDPKNELIENESITRTVFIGDNGDVARVECTELKPKAGFKALFEATRKTKATLADNGETIDPSDEPYLLTFTDSANEHMNDFVACLKTIYQNPVANLVASLAEMDAELSDDESGDAMEDIEEDPEEQEDEAAAEKQK